MISFAIFLGWILELLFTIYKFTFHLLTGKCALLRVILSKLPKGAKLMMIEKILSQSKKISKLSIFEHNSHKDLCKSMSEVVDLKMINEDYKEECMHHLTSWAETYFQYQKMLKDVELLRKVQFDDGNLKHLNCLFNIWKSLNPEELLETIVSPRWTDIGFQGKDPRTDLRGMGMLGLVQLETFVTMFPDVARTQSSFSISTDKGYPFAISCINITSMLQSMLADGRLRLFFYSMPIHAVTIASFHRLFVAVYIKFHDHWVRHNTNVMQYNVVKGAFLKLLEADMSDERTLCGYLLEDDDTHPVPEGKTVC